MNKQIVFMFTGQGSQYYQMGEELYQSNQTFRQTMDKLDRIVVDLIGESVVERIYDPLKRLSDRFDRTLYTHPAIFMVEYALAQVLLERGITPTYLMGTSLGEFTAVALSGAMDVEQVLTCVVKHAQLLEESCERGGMLAILGHPDLYDQSPKLNEKSEVASLNYRKHFVVSGSDDNLRMIQAFLRSKNIQFQPLPVSYAFHSSLIDSIANEYCEFLRFIPRRKPRVQLISCLEGRAIDQIPVDYLWNVTRKPILFEQTMTLLEQQGDFVYIDVGPSGTMAGFVNQNLGASSNSKSYSIITPFRQEAKRLQSLDEYRTNCEHQQVEGKRKKMKAYVFPGQGSQSKGMGAKLFDAYPDLTAQADEILGYSIKKLCLEDPNEELRQTQFTQPALYVVSALSYLQKVRETGSEPDYVAGHSVGEYAALFAAGAYDFATGLKLIQKRGALMATASGGGMAAVIGMSEEQIHETLRGIGKDSIDIANFNTPSQIVIAGPHQDILQLAPAFDEAGASNYIPLKVSGAFHSRYMKPSQDEFATYLQDFSFQPLRIPVISNITSRPYRNEDVHHNLTYQITSSVRWTDSIRYLMALGVEEIEEVGPGRALTGMLVKIRKEAEPLVLEAEIIDSQLEAMPKHEEQPHTVEKPQVEGRPAAYAEVAQEEAAPIVITAEQSHASTLGDEEFKKDYNIKYAYVVGSMHKGISSVDMVVRLGKAGLLGYFGSAGLPIAQVEEALRQIRAQLRDDQAFGVNFPFSPNDSQWEEKLVDLFLRNEVRNVEASGFMSITPALVRYRLHGLQRQVNGEVVIKHRILAKVARPEVAEMFLSPAPERIVKKMLEAGQLTQADAELLKRVPLADDLCVVADSGGPTEQGVAYALMPVMLKLREEAMSRHGYAKRIRVGAAGGIGSPEAVAAAFVLGAEFIMTGSINQCTVEAGTSAYVKDLLNDINVQDTAYAPAEEQFEMGAKVQVLKKGLFFPARANKLFHLYNQYNSIHEIDEKTKKQLQEKYFGRTFERVYEELATYVPAADLERAAKHPKLKMAMIFKWYLRNATQLAIQGDLEKKVDFQVQCGPALGSFNQWVKGSPLESWKNRRVSDIADLLMQETATLLAQRLKVLV